MMFTTPSSNNNTVQARRDRVSLTVLGIYFGLILIVASVLLVTSLQTGQWQFYVLLVTAIFLGTCTGTTFQLVRRGNLRGAAAAAIGSLDIAVVVLVILFSGLGALMSLTAVFMGLFFSIQLLSAREVYWGVGGALAGGLLTTLADIFIKQFQLDSPEIQTVFAIVVTIVAVSFIASLITQFRYYPVPSKLIATFLIVALLPIGTLTYLFTLSSRQAQTDNADTALLGTAQQVANYVDAFINTNLDTVQSEAQISLFAQYLALSPEERDAADEHINTVVINDLLGHLLRRDPIYINSYTLFDAQGVDVADTYQSDIGSMISHEDPMHIHIHNNAPFVSPVEISPTTGEPEIHFSAPVRDEASAVIGMLHVRYKASVLQQLVVGSVGALGISGIEISLVDENHVILAHSVEPELIHKSIVPLAPEIFGDLQAANRLPANQTAEELSIDLPEFEQGLNNAANQPIFEAETLPEETDVGERVAVSNMDTQPWLVVVAQEKSIFLAPATAQAQTASLISLFITILVAAMAFVITQQFNRPIATLTRTAEKIAAGNLDAQASVESQDEIGELAQAFNAMTGQLIRSAAELATVAEMGTTTSTILETDKLLQQVVDLTKERFGLYHAHIYLLDEAGENLVLASGAGEPGRQMMEKGFSIPLNREQSLVARAARERQGVTVNDVTQAPDFLPNPLLPNTRSELAVPMIVGDQLLGVFDVQSDVVGRFTNVDIDIQTTLASQIATSMQNARQVERAISAAAELAGFQSAVSEAAIVATTDIQGKILDVSESFVRISKYSREELIGQDHRIFNSGYHPKEFFRDLWDTIANGKVWRNEICNKAKDGSLFWVDTTISPVLNDHREPVKYVEVRFDITQRKEIELTTARRAENLGKLDAITQKIQSTTTVEDALKIAVRELGHALDMKTTRVTLGPATLSDDNGNKN